MARVYVETSFVSACVSTRTSLRSQYERQTSLHWWNGDANRHAVFVSDEVLLELSQPTYPRRTEAIEFIRRVPVIGITRSMTEFALALVDRKVMPQPIAGDALHVAIATVSRINYLLTWNVKHLANPNNRLHLTAVCEEFGYACPLIVRPDDLQELKP